MGTRFDDDTGLRALESGHFEGSISRDWWIVGGPNGGYLAALVLRAMTLQVDDPLRQPRSLTLHYLRRPEEGPARFEVQLERRGRGTDSLSLRMLQNDKLLLIALGVFGLAREGSEFCDLTPPELPPPEQCVPVSELLGSMIPMHDRYEGLLHPATLPFSQGGRAESSGWIRLNESRTLDPLLLTAMTDAMPPALFSRVMDTPPTNGVPTLDLTIHLREPTPIADLPPDARCMFRFRSRHARQGYMEEDGEIWSPDGILLAQSRQLALVG